MLSSVFDASDAASSTDSTDVFLDHCFPCDAALPSLAAPRALLLGPHSAHTSSLLFQMAYNRARRGLSTLYVACGNLNELPPTKPRALGEIHHQDDADFMRLICIKHISSWNELKELLSSLHLPSAKPAFVADGLPRGLILDGVSSLFQSRAATGSECMSQPAAASQTTPSPGKPEHQRTNMFIALALALAAHAADHLDAVAAAAAAPSIPTDAAPSPPSSAHTSVEPALLIVSCSAPAPEVELSTRWLPMVVRVAPTARGAGTYTLRCRHGALGIAEAERYYRVGVTGPDVLDEAEQRRLHPLADQFGAGVAARTPARALPPPCAHADPSQAMASLAY